MNKKDAAITKILSDVGCEEEPELTPEQEEMLQRALNSEKDFLDSVEELFNKNNE